MVVGSGFATSPTVSGRPTPSAWRTSFRRIVNAAKELTHSRLKEHATPVGTRPSAVEFDVFGRNSRLPITTLCSSVLYLHRPTLSCGVSRTIPLRMLCAHSQRALISSASAYSSIALLSSTSAYKVLVYSPVWTCRCIRRNLYGMTIVTGSCVSYSFGT